MNKKRMLAMAMSATIVSWGLNENQAQKVHANVNGVSPATIIGEDDRIEVNPSDPIAKSIGQIKKANNRVGTGFVVGRNTIITNEHVADEFKENFDYAKNNVEFYPNRAGWFVPYTFKVIKVDYAPDDADIAILTLSNEINTGALLGDVAPALSLKKFDKNDTNLTVIGYPGSKGATLLRPSVN